MSQYNNYNSYNKNRGFNNRNQNSGYQKKQSNQTYEPSSLNDQRGNQYKQKYSNNESSYQKHQQYKTYNQKSSNRDQDSYADYDDYEKKSSNPKQYDHYDLQYPLDDFDYFDDYITKALKDGTRKILIVAEKNRIAGVISRALALGKDIQLIKKGRINCFYFTGVYRETKANFCVTATNGHIFNRDFTKEFRNRNIADPQILFRTDTVTKATSKGTIAILQEEAMDCDCLQLWLDNDREGENICFEVIDVCTPHMRPNPEIRRAKFSSITYQNIRLAHEHLISPNELESKSVDARQIIDLKIGVTFSRFQSMYFGKKYPQLQNRMITFGPCQTPTLGFCVGRQEEIECFKPQTYYQMVVTVESVSGFKIVSECETRLWKESEAIDLTQQLKQHKYMDISGCRDTMKQIQPPKGINTVSLLKFASSSIGIGPQEAMQLAERLYLQGYISYPRTETTDYPEDFETLPIMKAQIKSKNPQISRYTSALIKKEICSPPLGIDAGDHSPITPTTQVPHNLNGLEKSMYEYIVKMFLASHSEDCIYINQRLEFRVTGCDLTFFLQGNNVTEKGFTGIADWLGVNDDSFDPDQYFHENGKVKLSNADYKLAQTSPPDYLTESELLSLMESNSIGTDASMASHINNICERGYVKVDKISRRLVPTELGVSLVKGYKKIDPELVSPQLRSNIEQHCKQIAKGEENFSDVLYQVIKVFEEKYVRFKSRIEEMDILLGPDISSFRDQVSTIGGRGGRGGRGRGRGRGGRGRMMRTKNDQDF